jgi:NAD(P)-dependent dehydrogenase (short-subunit alcohol dehydrogenase family)
MGVLQDKVIVVTGGSRGFGLAIAQAAAAAGAQVVVSSRTAGSVEAAVAALSVFVWRRQPVSPAPFPASAEGSLCES